jgi:mannose-6-phosphate isomerase
MTHPDAADSKAKLAALNEKLIGWLVNDVYPRWALHGIDRQNGGFIEAVGQDGLGLAHPRRARVHPRQIYAFSRAHAFGWRGDAAGIISRGLRYFTSHYQRGDGLFRTLAAPDGTVLDDRALLYDQAFALLGLAAAATALEARSQFEKRALTLRSAIESRLRMSDGSFISESGAAAVREANPHMHLLEACLAWADIGSDAGWAAWAQSLAELAAARFIRRDSGVLGECYTADWQPAPGLAGRFIEPGHHFEWAWLLLRCESRHRTSFKRTALRLVSIGEQSGVRGGVAVNQLLDDMTISDAGARFWPQTERLKASLLAATLTGEPHYWSTAHQAALSFFPYMETPLKGLWFDLKSPQGAVINSPAPASTLYHLVGAVVALDTALRQAA